MFGRNAWMVWQGLCSFALGFLFYSIYTVFDRVSGGAMNAWVSSGINWGLAQIGISSTMLSELLQGQNLVGFFVTLFSMVVFFMASRPRKQGGTV